MFHSTIVALGLFSASAAAGTWSFINLTGDDFETGIDPSKTYTHLVDFGPDATAAAINGVQFTAKGRTGVNYSLVGVEGDFVNNANALASGATGLGDLLTDFYYGDQLRLCGACRWHVRDGAEHDERGKHVPPLRFRQ